MGLSLTYDEIRRETGRFLGYGSDYTAWSSDVTLAVTDVIRRASRRFYFPEAGNLPDDQASLAGYDWTFLESPLTVSLSASTQWYDLPSDFIKITERPSINGSDYPLVKAQEFQLRDLANAEPGNGFPQYYAIRRNVTGGSLGYQIGFYPVPSASLTLVGRYLFDPPDIGSLQAPIVTAAYSEAFMSAILATADEVLNYETQSEGRQLERFKTLLASAIIRDQAIGG